MNPSTKKRLVIAGYAAVALALAIAFGLSFAGGEDRSYLPADPPRDRQEQQPAPTPAPAPVASDAADDDPPPTPEELAKQEIVDALNGVFVAGGVKNALATYDEADLMIMTPPGQCDAKVLRDLNKTLVALKLDPKRVFATMQCNGGPLLKLR